MGDSTIWMNGVTRESFGTFYSSFGRDPSAALVYVVDAVVSTMGRKPCTFESAQMHLLVVNYESGVDVNVFSRTKRRRL